MLDNIHILDVETTLDIPCDRVIAALQKREFERILVIGFEKDSDHIYCASHTSEIGEQLLLMERAKQHLLFDCEAE